MSQVLIVTPEPPYPLRSGGAYRTASLVHYFSRIADVDLILLSNSGQPALLPRNLVRSQQVIALPANSRSSLARYWRNARRALRGVPPLIDRLGGFQAEIAAAVRAKTYDLGVVEHFWCAPYVEQLRPVCRKIILNLHNVESCLHRRCAHTGAGLQAAGHRRFAGASERMEQDLFPIFDLVLAASAEDAAEVKRIAPAANAVVYPNALPTVPVPRVKEEAGLVAFTGNFEYHPNIDGVRFFSSQIWPRIRQQIPEARVQLIGKGDEFIRHLIPQGSGIEATGPIENAMNEIARASVVVAPLRTGSGTRIKILEAWAAGRPLVATPLAAEGLAAEDGKNILLAESAKGFAAAVVRLLRDPAARTGPAAAGRRTFESRYTWGVAWRGLDAHLQILYPSGLGSYTG